MDRKDSNEYSTLSDDIQRDQSAKEGPSEPLGKPDDNHNIPHPYSSDIQTQLAAASTQNKNISNKNQQSLNDINENDENILSEDDNDIISKD